MKDPVCGMDVDPARAAGTSVYHGRTYYFCSSGCKATFDLDPARYAGHGSGEEGGAHHGGAHGAGPHGHRAFWR